jgi:hypothetical protein
MSLIKHQKKQIRVKKVAGTPAKDEETARLYEQRFKEAKEEGRKQGRQELANEHEARRIHAIFDHHRHPILYRHHVLPAHYIRYIHYDRPHRRRRRHRLSSSSSRSRSRSRSSKSHRHRKSRHGGITNETKALTTKKIAPGFTPAFVKCAGCGCQFQKNEEDDYNWN